MRKITFIKITFIIIIIIFGYVGWEIIYLSSAPTSKYYCPTWSLIKEEPISLSDAAYPQHDFKIINDASCLNKTRVYDIIKVNSINDIHNALKLAKKKRLHVSISGIRHSMGGQAFFKDAIVLDMTGFSNILSLDEKQKIITVQSGATWHDMQIFLNSKNLAIKTMQSTDIFTVGGSLSVNAHGMDHNVGSIAPTVKSFTIMLANETIEKVTPENNPQLFNLVIGGYGLFGIILEVELEVTDNVMYKQEIKRMNYKQFPEYFDKIMKDKTYGLFYAHISTSPITFFQDIITYEYKKIENYEDPFPELRRISLIKTKRLLLNLSKIRWYAQIIKWIAEKYIDPFITQVFKKSEVSRNEIMHDSVKYLENITTYDTDILHEYFIPRDKIEECITKMGRLLKDKKAIVLNASIRVVHKESIFLNYAPQDMFALVLYLNQRVNPQELKNMKKLTKQLIDLVLQFNCTFFLPYQLYFTKKQLREAYPNIDKFFAMKRKYDPELIFMNNFYAKYAGIDMN